MTEPYLLRIHWRGGQAIEGPLEVSDALAIIEASPGLLLTPFEPAMAQSREAVRLLAHGVMAKVLEAKPEVVWTLDTQAGSAWAIPGREVLAIELHDPVDAPTSSSRPVGFRLPGGGG